jgi:hypothetical protein
MFSCSDLSKNRPYVIWGEWEGEPGRVLNTFTTPSVMFLKIQNVHTLPTYVQKCTM